MPVGKSPTKRKRKKKDLFPESLPGPLLPALLWKGSTNAYSPSFQYLMPCGQTQQKLLNLHGFPGARFPVEYKKVNFPHFAGLRSCPDSHPLAPGLPAGVELLWPHWSECAVILGIFPKCFGVAQKGRFVGMAGKSTGNGDRDMWSGQRGRIAFK